MSKRIRFEVGDRVEIVDVSAVYRLNGNKVDPTTSWRYQGARGRVENYESSLAMMRGGTQGRVEILLDEVVVNDPSFDRHADPEEYLHGTTRVLVRASYLRLLDVVESLGELDTDPA